MRKFWIIMVTLLLFMVHNSEIILYAQSTNFSPMSTPTRTKKQRKQKLSKKDIINQMKSLFEYNLDIIPAITGLSREVRDGNAVYFYKGSELKDLDINTLMGILRTANQHRSQKNFERLQKQLKDIKRVEQLNKLQTNPAQIGQYQRELRALKQLENLNRTQKSAAEFERLQRQLKTLKQINEINKSQRRTTQ